MPFSDDEKREITECVVQALALSNQCACNLTESDRAEMGHLVGMVRDIGCGDVARGVEEMRRHHRMLGAIRRRSEKVGLAITTFFFISLAGGVIWLLREGVKKLIER